MGMEVNRQSIVIGQHRIPSQEMSAKGAELEQAGKANGRMFSRLSAGFKEFVSKVQDLFKSVVSKQEASPPPSIVQSHTIDQLTFEINELMDSTIVNLENLTKEDHVAIQQKVTAFKAGVEYLADKGKIDFQEKLNLNNRLRTIEETLNPPDKPVTSLTKEWEGIRTPDQVRQKIAENEALEEGVDLESHAENVQLGMEKEIKQKEEQLRNPEISPAERGQIQKELKVETEALKTAQLHPYEKIAKGKAKQVWKSQVDSNHAYFTPVKGTFEKVFKSKQKEIQEEVRTAKVIQGELDKEGIDGESNLALNMQEVRKEDRIEGQYTVKTDKAKGDLDKLANQGKIKFPQSAEIGLQVARGMMNLHKAGYVHGDSKTENVLIYEQDGKVTARVSDFGKTKQLGKDKSVMHTGNPRFAAPEGRLSQKAEVYGTALMIIRTLEGEILAEGKKEMLIAPTNENKSAKVGEKRRGVEKFLIVNKDCPQAEVTHLKGKIDVYGRSLKLAAGGSTGDLGPAQREIHNYIDALVGELEKKHPEKSAEIKDLGNLLKEMTLSDPEVRPDMAKAVEAYEGIMNDMSLSGA